MYYIENGNNTHKLVSDGDDKGLIENTVLPNIAGVDGTYSVGIVSGSSIAMLTDGGSTITFTGIGRVELKFVSAFDRSKEDIVVIFVENPLHEDVFNIAVANGLESRTDSLEYVTRTNVNSSLTLNVLGVDAQMFNSSKLYMSAEIGKGKALVTEVDNNGDVNTKTITDIDVLSSYLSINPATENFGNGRYGFGRFNIVAGDLLPSYYYLEIPVTVNVYLNLQEYIIDEGKLSDLVDVEALLESKEITIKIYNKATALTVSSDIKAESGEDVNIVANLTTGYVNTDTNVRVIQIDADNIVGCQGKKVDLNIVGQDTIDLILTADNDNAKAMLEKAKAEAKTSRFSIWDLFNASVSYSSSAKGLRYEINIRLKDEYRYLNLEGFDDKEWVFKLNISNPENVSLSEDVLVAFAPQQLLSLRLENYSHLVAGVGSNNYTTEAEFVSSQTESSLIVPGESGLVKIFAEYSYSYFENITISSSRKVINGKEFFIRYQQMVYNKDRGVYESYAGITAEGESLTLKKVSYKNADGQYEYDGVLFV